MSVSNEGEFSIQSPEITSTVLSNYSNDFNVYRRRPLYPSLEPVLWNPNQENIHSRPLINYLPTSLNPVNNGNVAKCFVNDYCCFYLWHACLEHMNIFPPSSGRTNKAINAE
jgi:hypothetical protein